jgi:hypothetical protein
VVSAASIQDDRVAQSRLLAIDRALVVVTGNLFERGKFFGRGTSPQAAELRKAGPAGSISHYRPAVGDGRQAEAQPRAVDRPKD